MLYDPHVAVISETWLNTDIPDCDIFPPSYNSFRRDRVSRGGGVAILVKQAIPCVVHEQIENHESLCCKLNLWGTNIVIIGVYRAPSAQPEFLYKLYDHLNHFRNQKLIIAGDFNLPDVDWATLSCGRTNTQSSEILLDMILAYNLTQMVKHATRVTSVCSSILDLVFHNTCFEATTISVNEDFSDHKVVYFCCTLYKVSSASTPSIVYVKNYNQADDVAVLDYLDSGFENFSGDDVNILWNTFKEHVNYCLQKFIPNKRKRIRGNNPWITREIIQLKRRIKRQRKRQNPDSGVILQLSNTLKEKLQDSRSFYFTNTLPNFVRENPQKFWQYLSNGNKKVERLREGDTIIEDAVVIADTFNNYFQGVFTPCSEILLPNADDESDMTFEISYHGVVSMLLNIDEKKAPGPDNIPSAFLRRYAESLAHFLTVIFQVSFLTSSLPNDWLRARVVPVHKKGDYMSVTNFRPISLTCLSCKLMEHIVVKYLKTFIERNNLLSDQQHGFRQGFSTATQLVTTVHEFATVLDHAGQVDIIFLDYSKAFDKVPHDKLLFKLHHLAIPHNILKWVAAYLRNRSQFVDVNGSYSRILKVTSGVPQGSVLGPLLFLIYINDLVSFLGTDCSVRLFADDCVIFSAITSPIDQEVLNNKLNRLASWCEQWKMTINYDKTVHLCMTNKKHPLKFQYTIGETSINEVSEYKYLGVTLTSNLKWSKHIDNICSNARRKLGLLRRKLYEAPNELRKLAYSTIVRPAIEYASIVWDPYTKKDIGQLDKIQNVALRFIYRRFNRFDSPTDMLRLSNLPTLTQRRKIARLKFLYSLYFHRLGIQPQSYISQLDTRSTRHRHSLALTPIFARTNLYKNSFFPRTIEDWNKLPNEAFETEISFLSYL